MGNLPTRDRAIAMLDEAERLNPGPWVQHSRYVGEAAALIALPEGFVLMEKRMVDVALRHGTHAHIVGKWKATFQIKDAFEARMGRTIYSLFPHVVENTFGMRDDDDFSTSLSV